MQGKKGLLLLISSALLFSTMATLVRTLADVGGLHTVFYRFMFSITILALMALLKIFPLLFVNRPLLLLRGLSGGIATFFFYLSIQNLGVGKGTVISYSYPVFASAFSALFLKEKIPPFKWLLILVSFGGLLLLSLSKNEGSWSLSKWEMIAFAGSILSAVSVTLVKKLHDTDSTQAIFFSQAIIGFWIFVAPANLQPISLNTVQFFTLVGIGITAVGAQLIMTHAYKFVAVSTGASFYLSVPVINLFIGWIFFRETLNLREIIGSCIVIAACFVITRFKNR